MEDCASTPVCRFLYDEFLTTNRHPLRRTELSHSGCDFRPRPARQIQNTGKSAEGRAILLFRIWTARKPQRSSVDQFQGCRLLPSVASRLN